MLSNNPNYNKRDPRGWGGDPKRGAAMGRASICTLNPECIGYIYIHRVLLNAGGYDPNGTYFGIGDPVWWVAVDGSDGEIDEVHRASSIEKVVAAIKKRFPDAQICCVGTEIT